MPKTTIHAKRISEATVKPAVAATISNHPWFSRFTRITGGNKMVATEIATLFETDDHVFLVLKGKFQKPEITFALEIDTFKHLNGETCYYACQCDDKSISAENDDCRFGDAGPGEPLFCVGSCKCVLMKGFIKDDGTASIPQKV